MSALPQGLHQAGYQRRLPASRKLRPRPRYVLAPIAPMLAASSFEACGSCRLLIFDRVSSFSHISLLPAYLKPQDAASLQIVVTTENDKTSHNPYKQPDSFLQKQHSTRLCECRCSGTNLHPARPTFASWDCTWTYKPNEASMSTWRLERKGLMCMFYSPHTSASCGPKQVSLSHQHQLRVLHSTGTI